MLFTEKKPEGLQKKDRTIITVILVTTYHFLLIILTRDKMSIVWFELPVLGIMAGLAYGRRINPVLPLCYSTVCMYLLWEPAVGFNYITWFVILPLFFVLEREKRLGALAGWGAWTGILASSGIYGWLWRALTVFFEFNMGVALFPFLIFSFLIGMQHAIFLPLARFLRDRLDWPLVLIVPLLYTVVEYWMPSPMPIALSLSFVYNPFFLQPLDIIGVHGVSFLIVIVSSSLYFAYKALREGNKCHLSIGMSIAIITLVFHIGYGIWCFSHYHNDPGSPCVNIAMIQPVAPLKVQNTDIKLQEEVASELRSLSLEAVKKASMRIDLLLWPEGAGSFASRTPEFNPAYMRVACDFQKATSTTLLVQDIEFTRISETGKIRYYSTTSLIQPVGRPIAGYRKNILMPFGEYLPMEKQFPFLRRWLPQARSVLPGETAVSLQGPGGRIAPLICYEVLFSDYVRKFVSQGCSYIVNLTNDRWYGTRQQPIHHLGITIVRAIENRRPVARSTNSGISAFIDARGVIAPGDQTRAMEKTTLCGQMFPRRELTFYTRHGDILHPWILTPFALIFIGYGYIFRRPGRTNSHQVPFSRISKRIQKRI
jgi:apolipoprotein N-acyltransferase